MQGGEEAELAEGPAPAAPARKAKKPKKRNKASVMRLEADSSECIVSLTTLFIHYRITKMKKEVAKSLVNRLVVPTAVSASII